jgi:hypothetical protein
MYGNRQMFPSPIAEPDAARMNPVFELHTPRPVAGGFVI